MKGKRASLRYARALFETAKERQVEQEVILNLENLERIINEKTDFFNLINNPTISYRKKASLFKALFDAKLNNTTMQFLFLVLKKGRESLLADIIKKYKHLHLEALKIVSAEVITANQITNSLRDSIKNKLNANGEVHLTEKIDKSILGGFIINRGDLQYDASVRNKINNVKRAFKI